MPPPNSDDVDANIRRHQMYVAMMLVAIEQADLLPVLCAGFWRVMTPKIFVALFGGSTIFFLQVTLLQTGGVSATNLVQRFLVIQKPEREVKSRQILSLH